MARYPGANWAPTRHGGQVKRNRQGRGMLHVAVSSARSLPPSSDTTWHFYVAAAAPDGSTDGTGGPAYCEQYVDTDHRAYGGADGNDDQLIVETAGGLGTSKVLNAERWTRAQMLRLADLMRWEAGQPDGAPLELLPDARAGRRGWGPHRLGIKHSGGPRPGWWQPGCEVWSSSLGKECPGDAKVAQIPELITIARTGATSPEEIDMTALFDTRVENRNLFDWFIQLRAELGGQLAVLTQQVTALSKQAGAPGLMDPQAIADGLRPLIADAVAAGMAADNADQATEIVNRIAARLTSAST